jgi:hypothetical protein
MVVVHLTPAAVAALPEYTAWLDGFGGGTQHVMVNAAAVRGATVMTASASLQVPFRARPQPL